MRTKQCPEFGAVYGHRRLIVRSAHIRRLRWSIPPKTRDSREVANCLARARRRAPQLSSLAKILISLSLIAPLAFFMGMPFPLGLTRVRMAVPALVSWAWGVNGFASVLSALIATLIAMNFGFSIVVLVATFLYVCAAAIALR